MDSGSSVRESATAGVSTAASSGSTEDFMLTLRVGFDFVEVGDEGARPRWPSVNWMEGERAVVLVRDVGGDEGW